MMEHAPHLRVASYNIRKARGVDGVRDPARILQIVTGLDADIVALQEADMRFAGRPSVLCPEFIEAETDFKALAVADNEISIGWHGNAVLMRKEIDVQDIARIELPGLEPRGAVRVTTDAFVLVAAHLGLTRHHRRKQLRTIMASLPDNKPAIVVGDFNEWSMTRGFEPFEDRLTLHAPGRTFHAARPVAALDRIALSPQITLSDAGVEQGALARKASDHLPIWADLQVA